MVWSKAQLILQLYPDKVLLEPLDNSCIVDKPLQSLQSAQESFFNIFTPDFGVFPITKKLLHLLYELYIRVLNFTLEFEVLLKEKDELLELDSRAIPDV